MRVRSVVRQERAHDTERTWLPAFGVRYMRHRFYTARYFFCAHMLVILRSQTKRININEQTNKRTHCVRVCVMCGECAIPNERKVEKTIALPNCELIERLWTFHNIRRIVVCTCWWMKPWYKMNCVSQNSGVLDCAFDNQNTMQIGINNQKTEIRGRHFSQMYRATWTIMRFARVHDRTHFLEKKETFNWWHNELELIIN